MASCCQQCNFGFGLLMTPDQLVQVNAIWVNQQYVDKAAAMEIYQALDKPLLTASPCL